MKCVLVLAVAAAVAVLLVALRGGGGGSAQAAVERAAARTLDSGSSRFTLSFQAPDLAEAAGEFEVEGLMDYSHGRGRISYGHDYEMLFDGDVVYAHWPLPWRRDAVWVRYESGSSESDPLNLLDRAMHNPVGLLDFLTGVSSDVREEDRQEVRGVLSRHYEGTLDLQKVVDQAPADKRADLQDWLDFIAEDSPTGVPFGLWVDGDGVTRRLRVDQDGGGSVTIEYYDFGVPVEITPPTANQLISTEELMAELTQHSDGSDCDQGETDPSQEPPTGGSGDTEWSPDTANSDPDGSSGEESSSSGLVADVCVRVEGTGVAVSSAPAGR